MSPREALEFIATHLNSEWPERCQENVRVARAVLTAAYVEHHTLAAVRLLAETHKNRGDDCGQLAHMVLEAIGPQA